MSTASSKSRARRQGSAASSRSKARAQIKTAPEDPPAPEISNRAWLISCLLILLVAAFLRLYDLALVPLHHDEGVNGNFLVRLVREGAYQYDPQNYHGPTLYYFAAIISWILRFLFGVEAQNRYGLNTVTIRMVTALFGLATIGLILTLRRRLGTIGALTAAALLAVSPGAIYLSRYFIHETLFVFFTLGIVVAGLKYYEDGHPIYLILASASSALLFATKETFIINAPVLLIAVVVTRFYLRLRTRNYKERNRLKYPAGDRSSFGERLREDIERLGGTTQLVMLGAFALAVFLAVAVLFYSSFFTNYPKGVADSLKTFQVWTRTGQSAHVHPYGKYLEWLTLQESPLLLLGIIGAAITVWRPKNSFALFSALWAFGTLAAYSLVPYKTPWLTLNMILPLALTAGWALQVLYESGGRESLKLVVAILVLGISVSGYQAIDLNFVNYDNDKKTIDLDFLKEPIHYQYYVYVYAHTRREILNLVNEINRIARVSGEGGRMGVTIVSPDYWPLPWYLRDYSRVGYYGRMTASTEPVVIASEAQRTEVLATFGERYQLVNSGLNPEGSYSLRPGVELLILVRRDIASRQHSSMIQVIIPSSSPTMSRPCSNALKD